MLGAFLALARFVIVMSPTSELVTELTESESWDKGTLTRFCPALIFSDAAHLTHSSHPLVTF